MNYEAVRSESSILHVFPFSSEKKRGGVAIKLVIICIYQYPYLYYFIILIQKTFYI